MQPSMRLYEKYLAAEAAALAADKAVDALRFGDTWPASLGAIADAEDNAERLANLADEAFALYQQEGEVI